MTSWASGYLNYNYGYKSLQKIPLFETSDFFLYLEPSIWLKPSFLSVDQMTRASDRGSIYPSRMLFLTAH